MRHRTALTAVLLSLLLLGTACSRGPTGATDTPVATPTTPDPFATASADLVAAPASFDLAVGDDQRFIVGLFTADRSLVLGGEVELEFYFLGDAVATATSPPVATSTGLFLPVPGKEPTAELTAPTVVSPADGAGVYETTVDFDRAGFWGVAVTAVVDGEAMQATAPFEVGAEAEIVGVGDPAPPVVNPLIGDGEPSAIDSRARGDAPTVPDPVLHATTVADAIQAGRPLVVVVSTPTYCVSQFCGPITDTVEALQGRYGEIVDFVHLEVWQNFEDSELNEAAAAWIQTAEGGSEPWVFAVDEDGMVANRWDNVLDREELLEFLDGIAL